MRKTLGCACLAALFLAGLASPALADRDRDHGRRHWRDDSHHDRHHDHGSRGWRGEIRHFDHHDLHRWRSGSWRHGRHHGRLGWWWVVGGIWYFHNAPSYPYPDPYVPPVVVQQAPPTVVVQQPIPAAPSGQTWYYCDERGGYYPYVPVCPSGWRVVPATPGDIPS
ncbi:MAG: hypothetical protein ACOY3Z_05520 [Thermodesulfobacteriota bacterium]